MLLKSFYSARPLGAAEQGLIVVPLEYIIMTWSLWKGLKRDYICYDFQQTCCTPLWPQEGDVKHLTETLTYIKGTTRERWHSNTTLSIYVSVSPNVCLSIYLSMHLFNFSLVLILSCRSGFYLPPHSPPSLSLSPHPCLFPSVCLICGDITIVLDHRWSIVLS